jgi:hypothetical protein
LYIFNWCAGGLTFAASWYCLTRTLHISLAIASAQSMLLATFVMAIVSLFVSRRACIRHDKRGAYR